MNIQGHKLSETYKGKKVLITGGLGFIGSNLANRLAEAKVDVTVVDSLVPDYGGNLFNIARYKDHINVNISDIRDKHSLKWLVKGADIIFNLAGQTSHLDSMHDPYTDLDINAASQLFLLEAVRHENPGVRVVFASTRQIYGKPQFLPINEEHPIEPTDINGIHKMAGEKYHMLYHDVYGLWCTAIRLTNTYGPCMRVKDARQTFLGIWLKLAIENVPFEVWGGEQLRDFSYIDDTVDALLALALCDNANGNVFNIGGDKTYSLHQAADILSKTADGSPYHIKEFPEERKKIDIGDYYADDSKLRSAIGWSPKIDLQNGLKRSLDFYRKHLTNYL